MPFLLQLAKGLHITVCLAGGFRQLYHNYDDEEAPCYIHALDIIETGVFES